MQKVHLVVAALALAATASAPAQADIAHRRHARAHAVRAVPPPAAVSPAGSAPVAPSYDPAGSAIDQISSGIARSDTASRAVTTNAFGPILHLLYPPGQSGDL